MTGEYKMSGKEGQKRMVTEEGILLTKKLHIQRLAVETVCTNSCGANIQNSQSFQRYQIYWGILEECIYNDAQVHI